MKRLDLALVELGLAPSRNKAAEMINAGEVEVFSAGQWKTADKAAQSLPENCAPLIRLAENSQVLKYVSRGGLKLAAAQEHLSLKVQGWRCLDVGISTGGFTDCLLQSGAAEVLGVDVGHGQLSAKLAADPRLRVIEGLNAKDLGLNEEVLNWLGGGVDLCVVDVSFISLLALLPALGKLLPSGTLQLALVKPQFEVGAHNLDKHGVVRDTGLFTQVKTEVLRELANCDFSSLGYFACALKGQDGNQEFFSHSVRN